MASMGSCLRDFRPDPQLYQGTFSHYDLALQDVAERVEGAMGGVVPQRAVKNRFRLLVWPCLRCPSV